MYQIVKKTHTYTANFYLANIPYDRDIEAYE